MFVIDYWLSLLTGQKIWLLNGGPLEESKDLAFEAGPLEESKKPPLKFGFLERSKQKLLRGGPLEGQNMP